MSGFLALLKRELRSITREKTIMFAIIVQFFIASFSSIILVGIMAFYDPSSIGENTNMRVRVGIPVDANDNLSDLDMQVLLGCMHENNIIFPLFPDMEQAEEAFRRNRIDAILTMSKAENGVVDMNLVMPELDSKKTVVFMMMDEPLKRFENYLRETSGVELLYNQEGGKPHTTYEFLYSLIVPILMLFPALIAGSIVIDTVSEEFENKTFDTLAAAPVSLAQVIMSKISAAVVTSAIQLGMWVGLLRLNGIVIQNALFLRRKKLSALTIPWCIYTDPEVAHVGLSESEAQKKGIAYKLFQKPLREVDRAIIDGEEEGFVKILVKEGSDQILGATIVARHAGEMISEVTCAMVGKVGLGTLASVIHPYPTQAEAIRATGDLYNRTRLTPFVKNLFTKFLAWRR